MDKRPLTEWLQEALDHYKLKWEVVECEEATKDLELADLTKLSEETLRLAGFDFKEILLEWRLESPSAAEAFKRALEEYTSVDKAQYLFKQEDVLRMEEYIQTLDQESLTALALQVMFGKIVDIPGRITLEDKEFMEDITVKAIAGMIEAGKEPDEIQIQTAMITIIPTTAEFQQTPNESDSMFSLRAGHAVYDLQEMVELWMQTLA